MKTQEKQPENVSEYGDYSNDYISALNIAKQIVKEYQGAIE